ncbi:glycosyltransferase [uncultured Methanobrevibacter sp.]|uniref:glycosyltransferase n=1 Tax=uncultured Methanobrevibacter sp. TaxID=253161 RepID=UPI0032081F94
MVKISVIMPVYNDANNLNKSINSVIGQTLEDIELICVDDGSTDDSLSILNNFANNDDRIKVFSQQNQGSGSARNHGISKATGEYIAFLDSDDYIVDKDAYRQLYFEAKKRNMDMVSGGIQFVNGNRISYEFKTFKPITELNFRKVEDYGVLWYFYKNMFKRDFIISNHIKFPDLLRGQDPVFLCEFLSRLDKFLEVPVLYYSYNAPSESKLNNSSKYHDYFLHFYQVFLLLIPQKKFSKLILEYAKILISMKNREVLVFNKMDLFNLLDVMDDIYSLFIKFGNGNLLKEINLAFDEIIGKINIDNIDITSNKAQSLEDTYSESIIVKDNSHKPLISLLMYVYNVEEHLPSCLESLINQTLTDFEVICIDDGSSDNSLNVLKIYAKNDSRINIFSFTHKGNGEFLNRAIVRANGDYIIFIDSKNSFETNFCEKIYQYNNQLFESKLNIKNQNVNSINDAKINELEYHAEKYQEYLSIKDNHIEMIKDDMHSVKEDNITIINENNDLKEDIAVFLNENNKLKEDNIIIMRENNKLKEDNIIIMNENKGLKGDIAAFLNENNKLKADNSSFKNENSNLKENNILAKKENNALKDLSKELESYLNRVYLQVHTQEKMIQDKDFQMKRLEIKLNNNKIENEYIKESGLIKHIIYPLSYIYLIYKCKLFEIIINIKLFRILNITPYFDVGFYFARYPEIKETFCCKYFSPQLHYVCFGFNENKIFNPNINCNTKTELYSKLHKNNKNIKM